MAVKVYRADELREAVERCIDHCIRTGQAPVAFVLHQFTDVPEEMLGDYIEKGEAALRGEINRGREIMGRYQAAKRWEEFKTFFWLERERKDSKTENGGYREREARTEKEKKPPVTIKVEGLGGAEALK